MPTTSRSNPKLADFTPEAVEERTQAMLKLFEDADRAAVITAYRSHTTRVRGTAIHALGLIAAYRSHTTQVGGTGTTHTRLNPCPATHALTHTMRTHSTLASSPEAVKKKVLYLRGLLARANSPVFREYGKKPVTSGSAIK